MRKHTRPRYGTHKRRPHEMGIPICVWPKCSNRQMSIDMPLCHLHIDEVYRQAVEVRWGETREEALTRGRRARAASRRGDIAWAREKKLLDTRRNQPGWIYYLHINDMVKIGYTTDIVRRIRDYPPNSPLLGVHPGTPELEKQFHEIFKGSLAQGREWFRPDPDVLAHCEKVVAEYGDPAQFEYRTLAGHETRQVIGTRNRR